MQADHGFKTVIRSTMTSVAWMRFAPPGGFLRQQSLGHFQSVNPLHCPSTNDWAAQMGGLISFLDEADTSAFLVMVDSNICSKEDYLAGGAPAPPGRWQVAQRP